MASRRDVNDDETPRGRLLRRGPQSLSDAELLSILLRTENRVAAEMIQHLGGMHRLPGIIPGELRGTSKARSAVLLAAVEFGCRLARAEVPEKKILCRMPTVAQYLRMRYERPNQEIFGALYLDVHHRLIHEAEIFRGALTRATVEPRAVLHLGLLQHAARLIIFHTHPSGSPAPSLQDIGCTDRINKACELMGIKMEEHIIVGADGWVALKAGEVGSFRRTSSKTPRKNAEKTTRNPE